MLDRIPWGAPSSASTLASWASAAFAAEYPPGADRSDDLVGGSSRARGVEIADDDVGAFGGQTPRDGAPDAGAAAGHQRDPARQLLLGGRQGELVELERPVLDVEGVLRRERDVLAERA